MAKITIANGAEGAVIRAALNDMFTELYAKFVAATAEADGYLTKENFATFLAKQDALGEADADTDGILTKEDWATFNGKQAALSAATAEADGYLTKENFAAFLAKQDALSAATAAVDGYLTKEDWATFNGKQDALSAATAEADGYLKKEDFAAFAAKQAALTNGVPFRKTVTLTAAAAGTPVHVLPAASVGVGKKAYITNILLFVSGETAWTDDLATGVFIQDTEALPVLGISVAKAQLTGGAILGMLSAGVTLGTPVLTGVGLTAAAGVDIAADANFATGSDIIITICGFIE